MTDNHSTPDSKPPSLLPDATPPHAFQTVWELRLRQASLSFYLYFTMTSATALVGLVGLGVLVTERIPIGTLTAFGGFASSAYYCKLTRDARNLAKDANDRLDRLAAALGDDDMRANS